MSLWRESRRSAVGHRLPARAPRLTATWSPAGPEDLGDEGGRRRLPCRARDPDRRPLPALEQQVAEAGHDGALGAQALHAHSRLGRPDVEVGDLGGAGLAVEIGVRLDVDAELAELPGVGRPGVTACEAHHLAFCSQEAGKRDRIGVEPLDEGGHVPIIAVRHASKPTRVFPCFSVRVPGIVIGHPTEATVPEQAEARREAESIYRRMVDALVERDLTALERLWSDDVELRSNAIGGVLAVGRAEALATVEANSGLLFDPTLVSFQHLGDGWMIVAARLRHTVGGGLADSEKTLLARVLDRKVCVSLVFRKPSEARAEYELRRRAELEEAPCSHGGRRRV